jgi:hypothetical protein
MDNEALILQLLGEVRDKQDALTGRFDEINKRADTLDSALASHAKDSAGWHAEILKAFPAGDTDGHRRYHETVIEWRELRNKIVREALINAGKVGGLGAIGWLLYAIWIALKMELSK